MVNPMQIGILTPAVEDSNPHMGEFRQFIQQTFGPFKEFETVNHSINKNGEFVTNGENEILVSLDPRAFKVLMPRLINACKNLKAKSGLPTELTVGNYAYSV